MGGWGGRFVGYVAFEEFGSGGLIVGRRGMGGEGDGECEIERKRCAEDVETGAQVGCGSGDSDGDRCIAGCTGYVWGCHVAALRGSG